MKRNSFSRSPRMIPTPLIIQNSDASEYQIYCRVCGYYRQALNIADAYSIPEELGLTFNKGFDKATGYRTKSMLTLPMRPQGYDPWSDTASKQEKGFHCAA